MTDLLIWAFPVFYVVVGAIVYWIAYRQLDMSATQALGTSLFWLPLLILSYIDDWRDKR